jgi:hypothetical protein
MSSYWGAAKPPEYVYPTFEGFLKWGIPKNHGFQCENGLMSDDLAVPRIEDTSIYGKRFIIYLY